jgi:hypothetical protein
MQPADIHKAYQDLQEEYEQLKVIYENVLEHSTIIENELDDTLQVMRNINHELTASINYAKRIQTAMLPSQEYISTLVPECFVLFKPRDIVSGDFYWCESVYDTTTHQHKVILAAVDCTGHGVPGAFMSMLANNLLHDIIVSKGTFEANQILAALNKAIIKALRQQDTDSKDGMDMTIAVFTPTDREIEFAAAQNPIYIIQENESFIHAGAMKVINHSQEYATSAQPVFYWELKGDRFPIGGRHNTNAVYHKCVFEAKENQPTTLTFYLFSDGFQDQFGGIPERKFMTKNFRNLLFQNYTLSLDSQNALLEKTLEEWVLKPDKKKTRQTDDILVMGFKITL